MIAYGVCDTERLHPSACGSEQLRLSVCSAGWVSVRDGMCSGVCISVMYALVYWLCACLSVSPCGARVCLWLGVSSL